VETLVVVLVVIQGNFGEHFIVGRRWRGTWILSRGLVENEDEEIEEGAS
jgi:hypothetical protein